MTTPRTACKHCGYMTRMVDTAICTDCQDAITDTPADPFNNYSDINNPVRLFLDEDVPLVRARVAELFDFDFCPFAFALALGWAGCERHEWETDENGQPQHPKRCSKCGYDSEIAEDAWR